MMWKIKVKRSTLCILSDSSSGDGNSESSVSSESEVVLVEEVISITKSP